MKQSTINLRVGAFVLGALILILAGVIILGAGAVFRRSVVMETYLDETVQGLDVGSAVKARGVQIGNVRQITFVAQEYGIPADDPRYLTLGRLVLIKMNVYPDTFGGRLFQEVLPMVKSMIDDGLRVRLASSGLTGTAYLELDYVSPERFPPRQISWEPQNIYIPSAPSTISRLTTAAEGVFRNLERTDIAKLINESTSLMEDLRKTNSGVQELVNTDDMVKIRQNLLTSSENLKALTDSSARDVQQILANLRDITVQLDSVAKTVNGPELKRSLQNADAFTRDLRNASANLPETMAMIDRTLRRIDTMVVSGQDDFANAMQNLNSISGNLKELTDNAKRYPSQVLFGEPPPRQNDAGPRR